MEVVKRFEVKKSVIRDMNMIKEMRDYFEIISFLINFKWMNLLITVWKKLDWRVQLIQDGWIRRLKAVLWDDLAKVMSTFNNEEEFLKRLKWVLNWNTKDNKQLIYWIINNEEARTRLINNLESVYWFNINWRVYAERCWDIFSIEWIEINIKEPISILEKWLDLRLDSLIKELSSKVKVIYDIKRYLKDLWLDLKVVKKELKDYYSDGIDFDKLKIVQESIKNKHSDWKEEFRLINKFINNTL